MRIAKIADLGNAEWKKWGMKNEKLKIEDCLANRPLKRTSMNNSSSLNAFGVERLEGFSFLQGF